MEGHSVFTALLKVLMKDEPALLARGQVSELTVDVFSRYVIAKVIDTSH